jgi:hypothetical protein
MNYKKIILAFSFLSLQILLKAQVFYIAERMPFNTSANSDMAPVIFKNGLIFSSDRKNDIIIVTVDQTGSYLYNLYYSEKKGNRSWTKPDLFLKSLSTRYNQSSTSISTDGKTIYYTGTINATGKIGDQYTSDTLKNGIFIATWESDDWVSKEEFPYNNIGYDLGYPCISSDGNRLFFAARDPKGYGEFDLYYSDKTNSKWTQPVNLGPIINTSESEVFPFIFNNNRLYFASRGHGGIGGLDIFYSDYINGQWKQPVNLPKPFNSSSDDFAFVSNAELDTGYFTSNRSGSDDIFRFVSTFPTFTECFVQVEEDYCYQFYEAGKMNLDTTTLKYEWDLGDSTKIRNNTAEHCFAGPGYYLVKLNVIDTLTGEIYFNEATYDLMIEKAIQPYILAKDTVYIDDEVLFDASESNIKDFQIKNYYWDFGDGSLGTEIKSTHSYSTAGNFIIRLGVTGNSGNEGKNLDKACVYKQITIIEKNK